MKYLMCIQLTQLPHEHSVYVEFWDPQHESQGKYWKIIVTLNISCSSNLCSYFSTPFLHIVSFFSLIL